ncbi:hypothetical protein K353_00017 [Kitasatospora sp. SolWspMP-SS2h]|uniref:hypothetical protein n=1 Tax=Kitasatospora sp. SolWspMP-SS2h TaxID=1305729 RepID=UPI000DBA2288|nr:hypothetical protein [Kitasatospora sp. SolWspMP-SS2h]RAJ46816.1 hypothetical protein K353_00017 [Kitasatospora sp. SolWspMP-SS2h]
MSRVRSAAALAAVALATVGFTGFMGLTATEAAATTPPTPYMCPPFLTDGAHGLYGWTYGQGWLVCNYGGGPAAPLTCRYNAFSGDAWFSAPNPDYCPTRAVPTAA